MAGLSAGGIKTAGRSAGGRSHIEKTQSQRMHSLSKAGKKVERL